MNPYEPDPAEPQDPHFSCQLPMILWQGVKFVPVRAVDVSFRGAFIATSEPLKAGQLLRLSAVLPFDAEPFVAHAMVAPFMTPGGGHAHPPGVGVSYYGISRETSARWGRFVNYVRQHQHANAAKNVATHDQRAHARFPIELQLSMRTSGELRSLSTRDVSAGGMFIATDQKLEPGTVLRMHVSYPDCGATFVLDAVVRRCVDDPIAPGMGVEFVGLDEVRRSAFVRFVLEALEVSRRAKDARATTVASGQSR